MKSFVILLLISKAVAANQLLSENTTKVTETNRTGKFIGWWGFGIGVVRFENSVCAAANGLRGICYTRRQCSTVGGYGSGKCAQNVGVCCVVQTTCGASSANNNTYFTNPNFPNGFTIANTCTLTIQRCSPDICQVRIDLLSLSLVPPNGDGMCVNDALFITGAASQIGRICGENSGQHLYLDFNGGNDIVLTIVTTATVTFARQWNIRISQIGCDNPSRAPSGCLMYYSDVSGTVRSFNYDQSANSLSPALNPGFLGTRQLASMNYGICIRMAPGYCSIRWSTSSGNAFAFSLSGDSTDPNVAADPETADCTTDYIIIPNGQYTSTISAASVSADRYCGNVFLPVTTSSKPFVMTVVTNADEGTTDIANRGFSLSYAQQACGSTLI